MKVLNLWHDSSVEVPDDDALWTWAQFHLPHVFSEHPTNTEDLIGLIDATQNYLVERGPSPTPPIRETDVDRLAQAAQLLGTRDPAHREHRVAHEGDDEATALAAAGLGVTPENRAALRGLRVFEAWEKAEAHVPPPGARVVPLVPEARHAAADVREALASGNVRPAKLGGVHSAGTLLADAPKNGAVLILKPGDNHPSPAAGITEERASQPRRECAFFHVLDQVGLGKYAPRADLISIEGVEFAAMNFLGPDYEGLATLMKDQSARVQRILKPLLQDGTLHKLAAMDYVLGQIDRHGENVMLNTNEQLRLIDEGSTFAGEDFNPNDAATFVPYYLRLWGKWPAKGTPEEKFEALPHLMDVQDEQLSAWLEGVDIAGIGTTLVMYGINPEPSLRRLVRLRAMAQLPPAWEAVNRAWTVGI